MPSPPTLVSLDPPELLSFPLVRDTGPKLILRIRNISQSKIIFKVKTTQPSWYFVRPNQQILEPNGSEDVIINLIASECNRFLEMSSEEKEAALNRHRFLVQTKVISEEVYDRIFEIPQAERGDEYQRVWEQADKDELKNHKLHVEYTLSVPDPSAPRTPNQSARPSVDTAGSSRPAATGGAEEVPGSPESIFTELQSLRKKYDAVVEYTVHLTAERDYHFSQLEELKREIAREKAKKKSMNTDGSSSGKGHDQQVTVQQGFSFFVVILVAVLSFFVARYTKT